MSARLDEALNCLFISMIESLYLGISALYAFLAGFVLKQGLTTSDRKYFFFFLVSLLIWHVTLSLYFFSPLGEWLLFVGRLNYATGPLFTFGLLGFFYHFPKKTQHFSPAFEKGLWIWTLFLAAISLGTDLIDKNEHYVEGIGPVVELGEWIGVYIVHMFAMPILTFFIGAKKSSRLKGLEKTKFDFSFRIFVPTMLLFVINNGVLPFFHIYWQFLYSPVFLIPIAITSTIAMYRFRFFDLPLQGLKLMRQVLLLSGFLAVGIALFFFLKELSFSHSTAYIIAALVALLIWQKLTHWIPEFTSSEFRHFRLQIQQFQSSVYTTNSFEELNKNLENSFLIQLHLHSAKLFLVRESNTNIGIPVYQKNHFISALEKAHPDILIAEEARLQGNQLWTEFLNSLDAELCIPLYLEKRIIGLLALGKKNTGTSYSSEEIQEILNTQTFLEICFINILLQGDLKEENDLMKKTIKEKTDRLRQQNKEIKKVLKQQSDFIAVTAHEFRTPLNVALFQLSDTLESFDHHHQVLDDMKTMEASLEKLKMLTQNLFDIQQFDLEKAELYSEKTPITRFTQTVVEELQSIMEAKDIQLSFSSTLQDDPLLEIDQTKMRQVLHNLISNASHFSSAGQTIEVQLSSTKKGKGYTIAVIDHGPGVPKELQEDIFDKFRTTQASKGMGLGLGLYLCKKIMELHSGSIRIEDTPGGGASFILSLPKAD